MNAVSFEIEYEKNIMELYQDIVERRYEIRPSICFIVHKPVKREIFAADFRDRVVHHLLFQYINPVFDKQFIADTYSCRKKKGTSRGIDRVNYFLRSCSDNYQKECWILKLDIEGYFMSMDRTILWNMICTAFFRKKKKEDNLDLILYLLQKVIFNDPTDNCFIKGQRKDWIGLPRKKSLFFAKEGSGFPIGNLTSQLFGNIYMSGFDHFVRETLGVKWYGRYVDDMIFMDKKKDFLLEILPKISEYLCHSLALSIHPKKIYLQPLFNGVSFLGVRIKPYRTYIGPRIKRNFFISIGRMRNSFKKRTLLNTRERYQILSRVNSYLGCMGWCRSYYLRKKMIDLLMKKNLDRYYTVSEGMLRITSKWNPCRDGEKG